MASGGDDGTLDFTAKDSVDVALYLKKEGIAEDICSEFEGMVLLFVCDSTGDHVERTYPEAIRTCLAPKPSHA